MDEPTLEDFLRRALVWPDPNSESGWINLHWRAHERKGITGSQAFKTLQDVLNFIEWTQGKGKARIADLYYCTSLQEEHGDLKPSGKYAALRSVDNAVSSRLLFADVDKYESKTACLAAIKEFCELSSSPFPSSLVDSGGGVHAYWFLSQVLEKEEWLRVAHQFAGLQRQYGLKSDNISTDMARILRPPDTLNYKRTDQGNPPQKVVLKLLNGSIDLSTWGSLHKATPVAASIPNRSSVPVEHLFVNPAEIKKGPSKLWRGVVSLEDQIEGTLNPTPILHLCPMFNQTLASGGEGVGQPVWHQQALAATFLEGGREFFHDLSRKHPSYSREATDEMYDRKLRDRAGKGLGYPSCATFERDGCSQCTSCTLKEKVKSPLNITAGMADMILRDVNEKVDGPVLEVNTSVYIDGPAVNQEQPDLGPGYAYDADGYITVKRTKQVRAVRVLGSKILSSQTRRAETTDAYGVFLTCTRDGSITRSIWIPPEAFEDAGGAAILRALERGGCQVKGSPSEARHIALTFRDKMLREAEISRIVAYGWEYEDRKEGEEQGRPVGFSYGGKVYRDVAHEAYGGDLELKKSYCVTGHPQPWVNAARMVLRMHSPGLAVVLASAFAAPLMIFSGHAATVLMVRGQSGGSKSTATAVACAVWARPRTTMMKPSASKLGMMKRMGRIRHLPIYWDDIRNEKFEVVADTLMEITQGGDGLKLNQNREEREQSLWDNMLLTSSNASLVEYLEGVNKNDGAALVRCFEFEVPTIEAGSPSYEDPNRIAPLIASLDSNHGHAGREYAAVLGRAGASLQEMYDDVAAEFTKRVAPVQPHERFWMAASATIVMGAMLANTLPLMAGNGIKFDIDDITQFLVKEYLEQRERYADANRHADSSQYIKHWLGQFINHYAAPRNEIVYTQEAPRGPGKPVMSAPEWPLGEQARQMKLVSVRWVRSERKLKFTKTASDKFLRQEKVSINSFKDGLVKHYGARIILRGRIAAGLANIGAGAPEVLYEIDVKPGTWLDDLLQRHATEVTAENTVPPLRGQNQGQ
jgi:hypothetical protein